MVHAAPANMGLDVDNLSTLQGTAQLQLLLGHINKGDRTGCLIEIRSDYLDLEIGLGKFPLAFPRTVQYKHVSLTWISSICQFLHRTNSWVERQGHRVVQDQQQNNHFIMQLAMDDNFDLRLIQQ